MASLPDTRYSLLARLAEPADAEAWSEFVAIYEEAIFRYSRNRGLQDADAQEVVQQVLLAVHQAIGDWKPTGRAGSFRTWLVQSAHRSCLKMLRGRAKCDRATGGTSVVQHLAAVADCDSTQAADDLDWQKWAFSWAAALVQREIEPATWQAFWLTAVEGLPAAEVAARVNLRIGSVYAAKCRILARIRERTQRLSRERL
jgi:RNA polymerase sigma factor (sigma-70 family)